MYKMFLRFLLVMVLAAPVYGSDEEVNQEPLVISNAPEHIARSVFVGPDHKMPTDGRWRISIAPTVENGEVRAPSTIVEAFQEMAKALPHWYQAALRNSSGSLECFVLVNNLALHTDVMNWLWVRWELEEPNSELRKALEALGAETRDQVMFGLHDGFCYYLKYGEDKALELLTSPTEEWGERELPPLELPSHENL